MSTDRYPKEVLDAEDDDGTMPANIEQLTEAVIGHRIISAEQKAVESEFAWLPPDKSLILTLDNGTKVRLADTDDCCAYTALRAFILHPEKINHVITGVGTTDYYTKWHIYADFGDVVELDVGWSCGNPFYYGYGFDITVEPVEVVDDH